MYVACLIKTSLVKLIVFLNTEKYYAQKREDAEIRRKVQEERERKEREKEQHVQRQEGLREL